MSTSLFKLPTSHSIVLPSIVLPSIFAGAVFDHSSLQAHTPHQRGQCPSTVTPRQRGRCPSTETLQYYLLYLQGLYSTTHRSRLTLHSATRQKNTTTCPPHSSSWTSTRKSSPSPIIMHLTEQVGSASFYSFYYRPRSRGDNTIGSVRPSVCLSVCLSRKSSPLPIIMHFIEQVSSASFYFGCFSS